MQDESGTSRYSCDAWGNLVEMRHTELEVEYVSGYTYDAGNRVIAQTLPSGRVVEYSRDALRRVTAVRTTANGVQQSIVSGLRYRADDRKFKKCTSDVVGLALLGLQFILSPVIGAWGVVIGVANCEGDACQQPEDEPE